MKITKAKLKQIIKEELSTVLMEFIPREVDPMGGNDAEVLANAIAGSKPHGSYPVPDKEKQETDHSGNPDWWPHGDEKGEKERINPEDEKPPAGEEEEED